MTSPSWQVSGRYFETCSCDFVCPCILGRMAVRPMSGEGAMGVDPNATEPMFLENTGHPVSSRLAVAHVSNSHLHALGLSWDDASGKNNGHYAPFTWRSA